MARQTVKKVAALGASAGAFVVLFTLAPVHARTVDEPALALAIPTPERDSTPVIQLAGMEAPPVQGPALVEVPDLRRQRVASAESLLRRNMGLRVRAYDPYGDRIHIDGDYYRIRSQSPEAGSMVAPGTVIEVRAREIGGVAAGY